MSSFLIETPSKPVLEGNQPNQPNPQNQQNQPNQNAEEQYIIDNATTRKIEFDRGNPLSFNLCSNKVFTIPSSFQGILHFIWSTIGGSPFLITIIFVLLFYLISYIASPSEVTTLNLAYSVSFHLVILVIQLIIAFAKFIKICMNDSKVNNQSANIYHFEKKMFIKAKWKDILVGQIIRVNQDEVVPADIIILEAMDHNHECHVDYSAINGIFDSFVLKKACNDTQLPSMKTIKFNEYVKNIKGVLRYEEPNSNLHAFIGKLKLESFPRAYDVTDENFVMRGSTIKNIKLIYGLVVYTGMETKIMQTLKISERNNSTGNTGIMKRDRDIINVTLKFIQYLLLGLYFILLLISILIELYKVVICYYSFHSPIGDDHLYLQFYTVDSLGKTDTKDSDPFFEMFLSVMHFVLTYHFILPFNWFGLIDIAYILLGKFIQWDSKVLQKASNQVEIINNNCLADFGQVKHILTDKTGTLTSRKYILKACSLSGKLFSFDPNSPRDENYLFSQKKNDLSQLELVQELKINSPLANQLNEFFESLCLCHSVKVTTNDHELSNTDHSSIILGSSYADERSTLKMMEKLGYKIEKTKNSKIFLTINKVHKTYMVLAYNKYTDERRRLSILVKNSSDENDEGSVLLCKANDFSIFNLCRQKNKYELTKTKMQIKEITKYGYRFFIFCKRALNEEETNNFLIKYRSAENYVLKSEEHLKALAIEYEQDFDFLGVLFFEEKIPNHLPFSISKLNNAGIKVWIASGDKKENVLSVAKNLGLYNSNAIKGDFSDKDKPEDLDIKMSMLLMQFLFPNDKINKMKTRKGVSIETQAFKGSKELTIVISGNCFTRIYADPRNFQSLATLLSYCTNFLGYGFNPNNKYLLCKMIRKYVSNNSKVLAVGDGFNDFTMLKEADLSIGIRSKEILQVRNSCDIIVNKFSQITDLILVHGTFSYHRLINICLLSFYANFLIVFPMFIHQNANPIGSTFYCYSPLKLTLEILVINLSIIFLFVFDYPVERALISTNSHVYKSNLYSKVTLIFEFGLEFIKSGADSLILYYLIFSLTGPINNIGENPDQEIFGNGLLYTSYAIILFKIVTLRLNTINYLHVCTLIITIGALIGIVFVEKDLRHGVLQGLSSFAVVFESFLALTICFLYEYTAVNIMNFFISPNFILKLTLVFQKVTKQNLLFKNLTGMIAAITKEAPVIVSKIDKITYPEVLGKIFAENKTIDAALESMADVSNEEIAMIKIRKPFLCFHDKKLEEDYVAYSSLFIEKPFFIYLASLLIFWIVEAIINGFGDGQVIYRLLNLFYIILGLIFLIESIQKKFDKYFAAYFFLILTIEIICIYIHKEDNDIKICMKTCLLFTFPLFFSTRRATLIFPAIIYYTIGITPSIYLNDFGFTRISNQTFFLYSNLPLLYHRNIYIYAIVIAFTIFTYYSELESRIEFLKYHKSQVELKKYNLILANLLPEFVRKKMINGDKGIEFAYEIVTLVFIDISDFDSLVAKMNPKDLIYFLDDLYSLFDQFCFIHGLQKIETVGKTYMAAGGIKECEVNIDPMILTTHHAIRTFEFGADILNIIQNKAYTTGDKVNVKIGIHTGKVIPAVVGNHKPQFSLIGDTVNTTARMCVYSLDNCVNCSEFAYEEIKQKYKDFSVSTKEIKGKGMMNLYLYNPLKNKKNIDSKHNNIKKDSSGNLIMKSVTRNCQIYVKQGTKTSIRNINPSTNNLIHIKNDQSPGINHRNSVNEHSVFIVESSHDNINDSNMSLTKNKIRQNDNNPLIADKKDEIVNHEPYLQNDYFKKSFMFYRFKETVIENGFARFEKHKFQTSENLSIFINVLFVLVVLMGIYLISQYALLSDDGISIFIAINAILLILLVGIIYQTKLVITNYGPTLSYLNFTIYSLFTIVNQVEMNILPSKFLINLAIEEILTIFSINFNGMLSYKQSSFAFGIVLVALIINISINTSNELIIKYGAFLILLTVILYVFKIIKYYSLTMDFQKNQKECMTLEETEKKLFNLMPLHVVLNMKDDIPVADVLENVTMLFADIVRFTDFSANREAVEVVNMLRELFMRFDNSTKECSVYKVHTIGDCYVVIGFTGKVPMNERNYHEEAKNVCKMGENMIKIIRDVRKEVNFEQLDMRIGIHTGHIIAGIIGTSVVRYDIFGSDVLIANKMESAGLPGFINISEDTKKLLEKKEVPFNLNLNKVVQIPSVGKEVKCYFIENPDDGRN